jgi:hypothetical protein
MLNKFVSLNLILSEELIAERVIKVILFLSKLLLFDFIKTKKRIKQQS